jgi:hypothetical protein
VEDDPTIFSLYLQLIYTGRIPSKATVSSKDTDPEFKRLCNLYILAHDLKDLTSQNLIIDALHAKSSEVTVSSNLIRNKGLPSREDIETVFMRTSGPCGVRSLLVDLYASKATGYDMRKDGHLYPHEFTSELAIELLDT